MYNVRVNVKVRIEKIYQLFLNDFNIEIVFNRKCNEIINLVISRTILLANRLKFR